MTAISRSAASALETRLRSELWRRLEHRLSAGESLTTQRQFCEAIESAYTELTGQEPPASIRQDLRDAIARMNRDHPETFLARGVQNAVSQAFGRCVGKLRWDQVRVEQHGTASIRRFLRQRRVRGFLHDINLDPALIDVFECVRHGVEQAVARPILPPRPVQMPVQATTTVLPPQPADDPTLDSSVDDLLNRRLLERQLLRLPETIAAYEEDGLVSADLARQYRELLIDGELEEGSDVLEQVQAAVTADMQYAVVFGALQKIRGDFDGLLRTLVQHKDLVIAGDDGDRTMLMTALMRSPGFLQQAVAAIDRTDPSLQQLADRDEPYRQLLPDRRERLTSLSTEEGFVDDLRRMRVEQYADRLSSSDRAERARARSDIHGIVRLLDELMEATPFRRKVRLMIASRRLQERVDDIETIYRSMAASEARPKAMQVLRDSLDRVLGTTSEEEKVAVQKRMKGFLLSVEHRIVADDDAELVAEMAPAAVAVEEPPIELSEIERSRGALVATVEVRIEGRRQEMDGVVMPDPNDSTRMVLAERNADDELQPQTRKNRLRYVEQLPDGSWKALTG